MNPKAAVLECPAGPRFRAVPVLEPAVQMTSVEPGGDRASLWISSLIEQGLTLTRTAGPPPEAAAGRRPRLAADATASVPAPGGVSVYEGPCPVWGDRLDAAVRGGGMSGARRHGGPVRRFRRGDDRPAIPAAVGRAARDGALVGGIVAISPRAQAARRGQALIGARLDAGKSQTSGRDRRGHHGRGQGPVLGGWGFPVRRFEWPFSAPRNDGEHVDCHCLSSLSARTPGARAAAAMVRFRNRLAARRGGAT
jgi:hypothetical protein